MDCGCATLAGSAPAEAGFTVQPRRFPNLERVFARYIADCISNGVPFYINAQLNTAALKGLDPVELMQMFPDLKGGLGQFEFLFPIFTAIAAAASTTGTAILAAAPGIASIAGSVSALTSAGISANNVLQASNQPTIIPAAIIPQAAAATARDVGGLGGLSTNAVLLVGGGLVLLLFLARR